MRRAAVQAFRTARRTPTHNAVRRSNSFSTNHALGFRAPSFARRNAAFIPASLQSSMHLRNFSLAFISTLVASGAWYAYKGQQSTGLANGFVNGTSVSSTTLQSRGIASGDPTASTLAAGEEATQTSRRGLLVENDQFYTTDLNSDTPLSKTSDGSKRNVLEMLTPEQATERLRRNEESYLVGRGSGVVRYDVVQLPSNDPIEDDHAEKIVEVPQSVAATGDGTPSSDWMFWGVFDGHS
jgi:pyruvate dehydrogenase phosphatase